MEPLSGFSRASLLQSPPKREQAPAFVTGTDTSHSKICVSETDRHPRSEQPRFGLSHHPSIYCELAHISKRSAAHINRHPPGRNVRDYGPKESLRLNAFANLLLNWMP